MINLYKTRHLLSAGIFAMAALVSCHEDEFPQATVTFYPTLAGETNEPDAGASGTPVTISILTSRVLSRESQVNIRITGNGGGYGTSYFTYPPQLEPGIVTLTIPAGETTASMTFTPRWDGVVEQGDYEYTLSIDQTSKEIRSVGQKDFKLMVREGRFISYEFNTCSGIPPGLTERIASGTGIIASSVWACANFGYPNDTPNALEANAFGKGDGTSNSYLVFDAIDGNSFSKFYIDFQLYSRYSGAGVLKFVYSTNYSGSGNPEADGVVWNEVADMNAQFPSGGSRVWQHVVGTVEANTTGNIYFAFQFKGGQTANSSTWRIDNIIFKAD